ncbi:hypothetical protein BEI_1775 [Halomonas beimenensis]|uniref:Uncharacterized protein n=1 Tax=Halomonas beimenensis TaxID=475662 RepID=A0A291P7C1_9GAMM|nr:hypothetical protein BEI_1775 [Halomonas beimenensis]
MIVDTLEQSRHQNLRQTANLRQKDDRSENIVDKSGRWPHRVPVPRNTLRYN